MSISSELKDLIRRVEESERQASKYRNGEVTINLNDVPQDVKYALYPRPGEMPDKITLVVEFIPISYESGFSSVSWAPMTETMSGYARLIRVEKEQG